MASFLSDSLLKIVPIDLSQIQPPLHNDYYELFNQTIFSNTKTERCRMRAVADCFAQEWMWVMPFQYDLDAVGVSNWVFGARAAPGQQSDTFNLSHDMAHVIQLSPADFHRIMSYNGDLAFHTPDRYVYNRMVCEPTTDKMSRRELETFVIQWRMLKEPELDLYIEMIARLFKWLPDQHLFHLGCWAGTQEYMVFLTKEFTKLLDKWTIEKIKYKWQTLPIPYEHRYKKRQTQSSSQNQMDA